MSISPSSFESPTRAFERFRIRFRKEGDLRWISHRDLMRTVERMCRRAALQLRMSEGFHPKAKMSFPSALALGIEGHAEVMELDLVEDVSSSEVLERLNAAAPAGLAVTDVTQLASGQPKTRVGCMRYQVSVPDALVDRVTASLEEMATASSLWIQRNDRAESVDVLANLIDLQIHNGVVSFGLQATGKLSARPRDVLQALGLTEPEQEGLFLTRSEVEVIS